MEQRFQEYVGELGRVVGNEARQRGLNDYLGGLLTPDTGKTMEQMAERLEPGNVSRRHQSIHHFVADAAWNDALVHQRMLAQVLPALGRRAPITHWIVDDTAVLKQGRHSVGVAVQYAGQIRTTANCQVLVSLSLAHDHASLPVACELYLPEAWATDRRRRLHAGVPARLEFRTKHQIALEQIRRAVAAGLPRGVVLADGAYGQDRAFRTGVRELGLDYAVAVGGELSGVPVGFGAPPPRRATRASVQTGARPIAALAGEVPAAHWQPVSWRQGTAAPLAGRFAALRVRTAAHAERGQLGPEEWLLIQEAEGGDGRRYWLISLGAETTLNALVGHAKARARVEQDYRELKQEIGLDHFEGRGWRGLMHHITLCLAAYGFLVRERCLFPPQQPAAADPRRPAHPGLDSHPAPPHRPRPGPNTAVLSVLPRSRHLKPAAQNP